jgi:hypothetical protein
LPPEFVDPNPAESELWAGFIVGVKAFVHLNQDDGTADVFGFSVGEQSTPDGGSR